MLKTSLRARFPEIAAEWHPTKNGALGPGDVAASSARRVFWRCRVCAHVWGTSPRHRTHRGHGRPACAGRVAGPTTLLRARFPVLALEWHPTENGDLTPDDVVSGSNKQVTWRCARDSSHVWKARPVSRTRLGNGCPYCSGRVATSKTSLAALHPRVAREWHPVNAPLTPRDVRPGANRRLWWRCRKNPSHAWQATVASRALGGTGCPYCSARVATLETSLAVLAPWLARQWHPVKNLPLTTRDVGPGSERKVWWRCPTNPTHEWQAQVCSRNAGRGCPMCSGHRVTPETSLRARYPELARQWHRAKNLPLTPDDVTPGSDRRVWWRCPRKRAHVFTAAIGNRARSGHGCPMCSGRRVAPDTSLRARFPEIARQWDPVKNEPLTPDQVTCGSNRRVWWVCPLNRAHVWAARVHKRTAGQGCPFCAGFFAKKKKKKRVR